MNEGDRCWWCNKELGVTAIMCVCRGRIFCNQKCQSCDWKSDHHKYCEGKPQKLSAAAKSRNKSSQLPRPKGSQQPQAQGKSQTEAGKQIQPGVAVSRKGSGESSSLSKPKPSFSIPVKHKSPKESCEPQLAKIADPGESSDPKFANRWDKRDSKSGKFVGDKERDKEALNKCRVSANSRDFRTAKRKLKLIIKRQKDEGFNWAFKITSQKSNKFAKQKAHNWTSKNYDMGTNPDVLETQSEDESETVPPVKRICVHCKNHITGPQWSYLKCKGKGCKQNMTHFGCIGFPDITENLARQMKKQFECDTCHELRENLENEEADFETFFENPKPRKLKKMHKKARKASSSREGGVENPSGQLAQSEQESTKVRDEGDLFQQRNQTQDKANQASKKARKVQDSRTSTSKLNKKSKKSETSDSDSSSDVSAGDSDFKL